MRAQGHGGDVDPVCIRLVVIGFQIVDKEKELILLERTPNIAPKVVVSEMPHGWIEIVASVEIIVLDEFIGSAVIVVATRLEDYVYDGAARAAQLRVIITRRNVYGLDGFKRRYQDLQQTGAFVVVYALRLVVVAFAQLTVDFCLQRAARVEEVRMLESGASCAWHDVQKVLEIAIGAERYVLRQHGFNLAPRVRSLRLEDGGFRLHRDGLRHVSRLKDQVDALGRVHDQIDAGS